MAFYHLKTTIITCNPNKRMRANYVRKLLGRNLESRFIRMKDQSITSRRSRYLIKEWQSWTFHLSHRLNLYTLRKRQKHRFISRKKQMNRKISFLARRMFCQPIQLAMRMHWLLNCSHRFLVVKKIGRRCQWRWKLLVGKRVQFRMSYFIWSY